MKCNVCNQEMTDPKTVSCTGNGYLYINGEVYESIPHTKASRCNDCRVLTGGFHHPGCAGERCPRCQPFQEWSSWYRRQSISCKCETISLRRDSAQME